MNTLILGMGEVGSALASILKNAYPVITKDKDEEIGTVWKGAFQVEVMHVCFPWSKDFIIQVVDYATEFKPEYLVIHSTVPVGTSHTITGLVKAKVFHSPVRGHHSDMEKEMKTYLKYISGTTKDNFESFIVEDYFAKAGFTTKYIPDMKLTELMKLLELYRYGAYLAVAKDQERICDVFGKKYEDAVTELETTSNEGLKILGKQYQCQPILSPFKDFVGGHCVVEVMELLKNQVDTALLNECYHIDKNTVVWPNCNIYPQAKLGKGCSVGQFTEIDDGVVIGDRVRIGAFCFIPSGVTIEDDCFIAPRVTFSNDKHPPSKKEQWAKTLVKKGAMVGVGSVILPGITIGKNAVIGAGSVVTKDVPDGEVWYGNAAKAQGVKEKVYD